MQPEFIKEMYRFVNSHFRIGDRVKFRDEDGNYGTGTVHHIYKYVQNGRSPRIAGIHCKIVDIKRDDNKRGGGRDNSWTFIVNNFSQEQESWQVLATNCTIESLESRDPVHSTENEDDEDSDEESEEPTCPGCGEETDPDELNRDCGECSSCCEGNGHHICNACTRSRRRTNRNAAICCDESHCNYCGGCDSHCSCNHCTHCGSVGETAICPACERCEECCGRSICDECNNHTADCECNNHTADCECNNHTADCECENDYDETEPGKPWLANEMKNRKTFNSKRLCGVEWEYNRGDRKELREFEKKWRAGNHHDGSCGREIVTAPMAGDHIEKCIRSLCRAFENADATIDDRCGIHVHVDAKDYAWEDIYRLLEIYCRVEPMLYLLGGQERQKNTYCNPSAGLFRRALAQSDRKGAVITVASFGYDPEQRENRDTGREEMKNPQKKSSGRYKGINISPWLAARKYDRPDQTIEFRIHENSHDPDKVIGWVKLLVRIVDWCIASCDAEVKNLPKSPLRALVKIAPDSKNWIMAQLKEWRDEFAPSENMTHLYYKGKLRVRCRKICTFRGSWVLAADKDRILKEEKKKEEDKRSAEYLDKIREFIDPKYQLLCGWVNARDDEHFFLQNYMERSVYTRRDYLKLRLPITTVIVVPMPGTIRSIDCDGNSVRTVMTAEVIIAHIKESYPEFLRPEILAQMNADAQISAMAGIETEMALSA